ncbi:unnamed protein product, partial [Meganyctiphanes norvegica]
MFKFTFKQKLLFATVQKKSEVAPDVELQDTRESTSHHNITHGGYNMHNVGQSRDSWSMDQKQSEAAPHVEFQHPKAYASHYEAGQGGDNTDDVPESEGSWR